jgi:hypothetical protein
MPKAGKCSKCGSQLVRTGFEKDTTGQTVFHYKCQACGQTATKTMK